MNTTHPPEKTDPPPANSSTEHRADTRQKANDVFRPSHPNPLDSLFEPRSVAVIGATEAAGSVGRAVMDNLRGFPGAVYPINPNRSTVLGRPCFSRIADLPEVPDMVVIVTPAPSVPGLIRECGDAGVMGAVVLSAGFKEIGPAGVELETRLLTEARKTGMRVIGPNCLGLMSPHVGLNATFAHDMVRPGNVAFLSQSGALCTAILDWSLRENVGFSGFVSLGSMLDVDWGDLVNRFGDDPNTRSIICYMESVGDARSFLSAAREVALTKPIIVLKVGHTEAGARAAASHTGSLTGSDAVLDAAFRRSGVLRVRTLGELFDMAEVLAKQPRPSGPRLAIVTNAGGPGALAADILGTGIGRIAELQSTTAQSLNEFLPPQWSHGNPVDLLGDAGATRYARAFELVARDPGADGVLVILTPQAMTESTATAEQLVQVARGTTKPVLASWMGGAAVDAGKAILNAANIPTYDTPDTAARAFGLMWRYSDNLRVLYETPEEVPAGHELSAGDREAAELLEVVRKSGRTLLTESESKRFLGLHGFPVLETVVASTEDDAVAHATRLGFPVVVKLHSESITHKSDVGGVHLNVRTPAAVRQAWSDIRERVKAVAGAGHFLGVSVQRMVTGSGYELILGSSIDPQFGPVLLFGTGGKLVEILKDNALGLPPMTRTLARRLMEQTRIHKALLGVRGEKPVDLAALEEMLVRFAYLIATQPAIASIEINPLLVSSSQMVALDARVILQPATVRLADLPRPAIRPYPVRYVTNLKPMAGRPVVLRPIRPEDEPLMVQFHATLSEQSVYRRYFAPLKLQERIAHERLSRICFVDYDREMALVAEQGGGAEGPRRIIGVGRLSRLHGANEAEFALTVGDAWQNQGLGSALLSQLVRIARDEQLERVTATILADNLAMQHIARKAGFTLTLAVGGGGEFQAELRLDPA